MSGIIPPPLPIYSLSVYIERADIVDRKIEHARLLLQNHPHRSAHIKILRLEPSDGDQGCRASLLYDIFQQLSHQIQRLDVIPPPGDDISSTLLPQKFGTGAFFALLRAGNMEFNRLTHFKYALPAHLTTNLDTWMRMEHLTELEIAPASGHYLLASDNLAPFPSFRHLRRITLVNLEDGFEPEFGLSILRSLIRAAPNVTFLRLSGHWRISKDNNGLKAMGDLRCLKTLINWDGDHIFEDGRRGIDFGRYGKGPNDLAVEEATAEWGVWPEASECHLEVCWPNVGFRYQYRSISRIECRLTS